MHIKLQMCLFLPSVYQNRQQRIQAAQYTYVGMISAAWNPFIFLFYICKYESIDYWQELQRFTDLRNFLYF
jgi:myosin heavy subunit